jgi:uncharacterized protein YggE
MKTLKVQGKGEVSVTPDLCIYSVNVVAKNFVYATCYDVLNRMVDNLRGELLEAGVTAEQIKTTGYSITAVTSYSRELEKHVSDGYKGSHRVSVEVPLDKKLMDSVFTAMARSQSDQSISISFGVSDSEPARKQLLRNSVAVAKSNAETIAEAAGVTLGAIVSIDYGWSEVRFYDDTEYAPKCCEGAQPSPPFIEPDNINQTDTVTVVYEIL